MAFNDQMAARTAINGEVHHHNGTRERPVTVLVTGFGPFHDKYPVNPSFEITRLLPETLKTSTTSIQIICYATPIPVCYDTVRDIVPTLLQAYNGHVDLVLHIGMASGRPYYTIEDRSHRDGYTKNKDTDGKVLSPDHGLEYFNDCPPIMTPSLNYEALLQRWQTNVSELPETSWSFAADCRPSDDAGNYLCDYIYFNSLAWFERRSRALGPEAQAWCQRPVMFLHVPGESDPEMLEKGRDVAVALIEAMVDVWCEQRSAVSAVHFQQGFSNGGDVMQVQP